MCIVAATVDHGIRRRLVAVALFGLMLVRNGDSVAGGRHQSVAFVPCVATELLAWADVPTSCDDLIAKIQTTAATVEYPDQSLKVTQPTVYREGVNAYWISIMDPVHHMFVEYVRMTREDQESFMRKYLTALLDSRPQEAYRLWLAAHDYLFPINRSPYGRDPDLAEWQNTAAKVALEIIARDPERRARYFRMAVWHQSCLSGTLPDAVADDIKFAMRKPESDGMYWWSLRNLAILLIATGREDLLNGLDRHNARERHQQWRAWIEANQGRFTPSSAGSVWVIDPDKARDGGADFFPQMNVFPSLPTFEWEGPLPLIPGQLNQIAT